MRPIVLRAVLIALVSIGLSGLFAANAALVSVQNYPTKIVTIVVPYPAGGSVDAMARILAQQLGERLGHNFIVENRAGGQSGVVGASYVERSASDGYTLMVSASVHVITPFLYKNIPYDAVKDFTPISLLADGPLIVETTPTVPAANLKDFFALVRKNPQKFTFGTTSFGSASHLAIEQLKRDAGLDTLVVAYKGTGPALNDLMGGQIQLLADPMLSSLPLVHGGKLKALGITSLKRVAAAPEIPTVAESSGLPGFQLVSWYGLWGPKGLPPAITDKLQAASADILKQSDVTDRLKLLGFQPIGSTPAYFAHYIDSEMAKYSKIIKDANIKAE
jgi:tripartite-type tricarboxylate transporter receptor subunit TctC